MKDVVLQQKSTDPTETISNRDLKLKSVFGSHFEGKTKTMRASNVHGVPKIVAHITVCANTGTRAYMGHNSWHMR